MPTTWFGAPGVVPRIEGDEKRASVETMVGRESFERTTTLLFDAVVATQLALGDSQRPNMDKNRFLIALSESAHTQFGRVAFAEQVEEQRVFTAVWALESQINNGGFLQYFVSSDGDTAEFAPRALRVIGARACADVVERAIRAVSAFPMPASRSARENLVESTPQDIRDRLELMDHEFLAYPDDLTSLLFAYVTNHPSVFGSASPAGEADG